MIYGNVPTLEEARASNRRDEHGNMVAGECTCIDCELKLRRMFEDPESQRKQAEHDRRLEKR